jgi:acyl dehydratase
MMQAGTEIEFKPRPAITLEMLRTYADASGDFNPIHLDESVAKKMGLPGIIAHGMLTAGFLATRAREFAPGWQVKRFQCRFKAMTFPGDVISVGGVVKDAGETSITLDLQAKNQRGEVTSTAVAVLAKA